MLELLHIENIAIIEAADIEFAPGFNALTGETGAGKSIVIDSLSAVLGQRTSRELIRTGADKAFVSAAFSGVEPGLTEALGIQPEPDGTLLLQAGKMKMTVKAAQVRLLETAEEIEEKKKQAAKSRAANGGGTVQINTGARASAELDIRGLETLEAESVVENYLDAAQRSKLGSVTIIHGKGTGALRAAVHQMLKKNRAVKSFRLGRYGEGEAGVTVVELK